MLSRYLPVEPSGITYVTQRGVSLVPPVVTSVMAGPRQEEPNQEGLAFYRDVFTELRRHKIEPLVTICHYDTPLYIEEDLGDWHNPDVIALASPS